MTARNTKRPLVPGLWGAKNLPVATWNVRTLNAEESLELLIGEVKRFDLEILGVAETHWTNEVEDAFEIEGYVVIHACRNDRIRRCGVALIIKKDLANSMTIYEQVSERIVFATFDMADGPITVIQVYAPDASYEDDEYETFLDNLQDVINSLPRRNRVMLLGDFNAKVGSREYSNWPEVVGKFGLGEANERGTRLLQFCAINGFTICNTLFKHRECRRVTWISSDGRTRNQIDYIILSENLKSMARNCRVYNSADIGSDHSLLIANMELRTTKPHKPKSIPRRFDVEKLMTDEELANTYRITIGGAFEPLLNEDSDNMSVEEMYSDFCDKTNRVTKQVVGYKRRQQVRGMPASLERECQARRDARVRMVQNPQNEELKEQYKTLNRNVKRAVKRHKDRALEEKIARLERDFRMNNSHGLYKTVRELEGRPRKPLIAIKDKDGVKHTKAGEVLKCWRDHFSEHLNKEFPHDEEALSEINMVSREEAEEDQQQEFTEQEIERAIRLMKNRKSPGYDNIDAEVLKAGGRPMTLTLHKIFKKIWETENTPSDWAKILITPVHKKGDKLDPHMYRAISVISIPCKVFCRIMLDRMADKIEAKMSENQFGFRPGRGTVDAIFIVRQVIEKAREYNVPLHFNFVDFKSAFDTVWRRALWKLLESAQVSPKIVRIIKNMYDNTECAVTASGMITEWFSVSVGVRQGCLLSPVLFNLFLEHIMKELATLDETLQFDESLSIDIRYADDTTLLSAIFNKLKLSTRELEEACKKWGMKINSNKCKIMTPEQERIEIEGRGVENVEQFVFLGSVVPSTTEDVQRRIAMASAAFGRLRMGVWNRRDISRRLKVRLYSSLILPIAIYASETWTLNANDKRRLETFEMRCFRSLLGVTLRDRMRREHIREELGISTSIIEHIKKKRLRWFGHVVRSPPESYINKAYKGVFRGPRPRGRPPKRWKDQIPADTGLLLPQAEDIAADRNEWRQGLEAGWDRRARGRYDLRN